MSRYVLVNPFSPSKLALRMGIKTLSIAWFVWPTGVDIPNEIWIGSAVFAGLTIVTD